MVGAHVQSPIAISYDNAIFVDHVQPLQYRGYWPKENRLRSTDKATGEMAASNFITSQSSVSNETCSDDVVSYANTTFIAMREYKTNMATSRQSVRNAINSRINIDGQRVWNKPGQYSLENSGQSALLRIECPQRELKPFLSGGMLPPQNRYIFEQLHFHWADCDALGSEHMIDKKKHSMEAHLVHYNAAYSCFDEAVNHADGVLVVAFFIQASGAQDCPCFGTITDQLPNIVEPMAKCVINSDCLQWLSQQELSKGYFMYAGSLTTPPFTECVTWIIYPTPAFVSHRQVSAFRQLRFSSVDQTKTILQNYRPLQIPPVDMPYVAFARNTLKSKL